MSKFDDVVLLTMDACSLAEQVQKGLMTPQQLLQASLERVRCLEPRIGALVDIRPEVAATLAEGVRNDQVFAGVPTVIKDLLGYPGFTTGYGSRLFTQPFHVAPSDYVQALSESGLVVLGKSKTSEFGLLGTTESLRDGPARNPWNLALSPGGSSGGAAAAVAAGLVPIAHASDGGGSVRGPASLCGLFGFKPSRDRTRSGDTPQEYPLAPLLSEHCISRSVRDSVLWLKVTERDGLEQPLPSKEDLAATAPGRLRIGYFLQTQDITPGAEATAALKKTVELCRSLGHELVRTKGPEFDYLQTREAFFLLLGVFLAGLFDQLAQMMPGQFDENLAEPYSIVLAHRARQAGPEATGQAIAALNEAGEQINQALQDFDVLLSPTVPFTAFPLGRYGPATAPETLMTHTGQLAAYTAPASIAGWCAMSVPLYWSSMGLPLGSHFSARRGQDALLMKLAFQLEAAAPWAPRILSMQRELQCHNA